MVDSINNIIIQYMLLDKKIIKIYGVRKKIIEYLIKCDGCGKEKWFSGKSCRFGKRKFCSKKCINLGRKHSEEFKQNLSKRISGCNNPFFGKHHTQEIRKNVLKLAPEC